MAKAFLPVEWEGNGIHITGAVSAPTVTKPTRENMMYFVNRRWVANPSLGHAVMTAFHTLLPTRRFPAAVLFIDMPEDQVDVNVHPTKKEVKFSKDREVYEAIVRAIRSALLTAPGDLQKALANQQGTAAAVYSRTTATFPTAQEVSSAIWSQSSSPTLYDKLAQKIPTSQEDPTSGSHAPSFESFGLGGGGLQAKRIDPQVPLYNFSQLFNTFIVFQSDSEMFIADQHTVHERLNYERLMKKSREKKLEVQPLLVPVTVELSAKEAQVLRNNFEVLMELGMEVAPFGGNTFLVRSVPADLAGKNMVTLVKDLVDDLAEQDASGVKSTNRFDQARERAATFMSCRSAVMAGDRLNEEQMRGMVQQMREANLPFTCPHGRPTIMSIPLSELYRRFDRH
jgi:DNA mismatch repair protein MutL